MSEERLAPVPGTSAGLLAERLHEHLRSADLLPMRAAVTIALSGGLDSVVLLDLMLALRERWGWTLSAAHFDHRMRDGSAADADWVKALCERLRVPCRVGRSRERPRSEAAARELRYEFLFRARAELGADWLATAHQADDQAETVLFRLLRGSGLAGLAGIPARRSPGVVRPLLPFWREELEAYARARGLDYVADPTNADLGIARNRIRHQLIPDIETSSPDFRRQLHRLSALAGRAAERVGRFVDDAVDGLLLEAAESRLVVARSRFLAYDTSVRAHLLRSLVARVGPRPGRVGTRTALQFIKTGASGHGVNLAGGIVIRREFDRVIVERCPAGAAGRDEELVVPGVGEGEGEARIAGVGWRVRWSLGEAGVSGERGEGEEEIARFDPSALRFPLAVRSWRAGDSIALAGGTRKLKKLFVDRRVGRSQRQSHPLLVDRGGVLWVVGVACGVRAGAGGEGKIFTVRFRRKR